MDHNPLNDHRASPAATMLTIALIAAGIAFIVGLPQFYGGWANSVAAAAVEAILIAAILAPLIYYAFLAPLLRAREGGKGAGAVAEEKATLATIDPVTRTLNHRGVTASLIEGMAQAQRYNNPLAIAAITIDGLGKIKERHGEATGQRVLQAIAATITDVLRLPDRLGRYTEEQFIVVMPQTTVSAAEIVAERIRKAVAAAPIQLDAQELTARVSIGVTEFGKSQDLEKFLSNAQQAQEEAARAGDRVIVKKPPARRKKQPKQ